LGGWCKIWLCQSWEISFFFSFTFKSLLKMTCLLLYPCIYLFNFAQILCLLALLISQKCTTQMTTWVTYNSTLIRDQQHTHSLLIYIVSFSLTPYVDLGMFMTTVNGDECLMTKLQEVSLNYHFSVEQRVGSAAYGFFRFNRKHKIYN
jgi:hypothetical protein